MLGVQVRIPSSGPPRPSRAPYRVTNSEVTPEARGRSAGLDPRRSRTTWERIATGQNVMFVVVDGVAVAVTGSSVAVTVRQAGVLVEADSAQAGLVCAVRCCDSRE